MLRPCRKRTWAPRGRTPIQHAWDRHDRLSAIGALTLAPRHGHIGMYWNLQPGNIHGPDVASFLKHVHQHLRKDLILVWDRYQVHHAAKRQLCDLLDVAWLRIEWLPPYAPDLNPVEAIWNHTKCVDLADFIPDNLKNLQHAVNKSFEEECANAPLKRSFFDFAGLKI
jgi:transposase